MPPFPGAARFADAAISADIAMLPPEHAAARRPMEPEILPAFSPREAQIALGLADASGRWTAWPHKNTMTLPTIFRRLHTRIEERCRHLLQRVARADSRYFAFCF